MEITAVLQAILPDKGYQGRQELIQEVFILRTCCIGFPSKYTFLFTIFYSHDFGCMLGPPLGKQMGELKILDSICPAELHPPLKLIKAELILVSSPNYIN